ncbi:MAG: hypothetical protein ABJC19_10040 [Gemmatimonadota bacterium]
MSHCVATAFAVGLLSFGALPNAAHAQSTKSDSNHAGMPAMPGMAKKPTAKSMPSRGKAQPGGMHEMGSRSDTVPEAMSAMDRPLDIPHSRAGSGTSWIPDASATREYQRMAGSWMLMAHGVLDVYEDHQGTPRGDTQFGSANWVMGMAMRPLGGGALQLNAMLSAEPWTVGSGGYPLLLQSGEAYQGQPLHDRQHPHDLFMELAVSYEHTLSNRLAVSLYAAPVGEPALGPVAFMHRPSAQSDLFAPIAHHWQDATHVSFGVATVGLYTRTVKLEGSVFNGREPDENRTNFDFRPLDSWSGRVSVNPAAAWSLNASYGYLKSSEGLHPDEEKYRAGASIMRTTKLGEHGEWASALIYGGNHPRTAGVSGLWQHSLLLETNAQLDARNAVFGRWTWVQKTAEELVVSSLPAETRFAITTVSVGYSRELATFRHTAFSLGARGEVGFIPSTLEAAYGTRHPAGFALFARLRPMASTHVMDGMKMSTPIETHASTTANAGVLP